MKRIRTVAAIVLASVAVAGGLITAVRVARQPRADRRWAGPQSVAPRVTVDGDVVRIAGVRDFVWRTTSDFEARWVDGAYDLRRLDSVWYAVSRFGGVPGLAHAFLTFGFGGQYVAISVEARREAGEEYSPWRGMLGEYELLYVIGTERDVIGVRTHAWKEDVSLYPVRATSEGRRALFLAMVRRAERLRSEPESYDTLLNSCTSNIVTHVNSIAPGRVPLRVGRFLPGFSDRVAYEAGLIDSSLPFDETRQAFRLDCSRIPLDGNFSGAIRAAR